MSKEVKVWGSVSILSTIFSFIILGVLGWSGMGTLYAYDNKKDMSYIQNQMETVNSNVAEILIVLHEGQLKTMKATTRLDYLEEKLNDRD